MGVLDGKVAIITGATSGIGAETARLFVEEGARVAIAGRRVAEGEEVAWALGEAGLFVPTDVCQEADVARLVEQTLTRFGRVDCLFNNAGQGGGMASILDTTVENLDAVLGVNLRGVMLGMKHDAPAMIRQGSGSIVNNASLSGSRTGFSSHTYSAAKAAVIHLSKCVAVELGEKGVRVNSLSPGPTLTGIFAKFAGLPGPEADRRAQALADRFADLQPIPRAGTPRDVARAALFLASDASSFVSGQDLIVDGANVGGALWTANLARLAEVRRMLSA